MSETMAIIDKVRNRLRFLSTPSKPSMFRVGDNLRRIKPEAYDPEIIAIGPFHRGKPHLQNMEQHKARYLKQLFRRRDESSLEKYVTTVIHSKDRARECYAEDIDLADGEFVEMLILDSCFIVEFLSKVFQFREDVDRDDPVFLYGHIQSQLFHDLMLFENQIPFFIINSLFNIINDEVDIAYLIWPLVQNSNFPVQRLPEVPDNAHHLLGIVHHFQCSSFADVIFQDSLESLDTDHINSAADLEKAGISFQRSEYPSLFHIEFENKVMKIPEWVISDATESMFRNLIAYEYYYTGSPQKYVTDYLFFMHFLVQSPEDANVLKRSGIIRSYVGSNEMVYSVINQLGKNIIISDQFPYSNIFSTVNDHCAKKRNTWMATLKREHFNNPWTAISVFAAITLLGLTITQTAFAILSYRNDLGKGN